MFQQNEEGKKGKKEKEREAWEMRKGEKDIEMKDKNFHDKVKKKKNLSRNLKMHPIQTRKRGINTLRDMFTGLK